MAKMRKGCDQVFPHKELSSRHSECTGPSSLTTITQILASQSQKSVIQNSCHLYADDTIILKSASDPDSLISSLEREILNVDQWLTK